MNGFKEDIKEFENEDIINILDDNNNIYFISSKQIENISNKEKIHKDNIIIKKNNNRKNWCFNEFK